MDGEVSGDAGREIGRHEYLLHDKSGEAGKRDIYGGWQSGYCCG